MDDFGVLVERYGIKSGRNSAPMAASKNVAKTQKTYNSLNQDPSYLTKSPLNSNFGSGSSLNDHNDDIFGFNSSDKVQNHAHVDAFDDLFQMPSNPPSNSTFSGGGFDFDMIGTMFKDAVNLNANASNVNVNVGDDDIWGFSNKESTNVNFVVDNGGDLLTSDPVDDFWGKLEKLGLDNRKVNNLEDDKNPSDDLIPGFASSRIASNRAKASSKEKNPVISPLSELQDLSRIRTDKTTSGNGGGFTVKSANAKTVKHNWPEANFFDLDSDGGVQQENTENSNVKFQAEEPDLDSFFSVHTRKSAPGSIKTAVNTKTNEEANLFNGTTFSMDEKVPPTGFPDDFSSIFEGVPAHAVFEEIKGESQERRNLRFARHQRAKERMATALAEMNQREFEAQQEQEERHRIAEAMDVEMKRWAAGKEGNLRALLSSLQQVLGPEFFWRPVSLTDLITSSQVKVAYKKATLCVHPDKVQQKGATLHQKYVAEKAFDLLKEAYNKFNAEELR